MTNRFTYVRKKNSKYNMYREIFTACVLVQGALIADPTAEESVAEDPHALEEMQVVIAETIKLATSQDSHIEEKVFYAPKKKQTFFLPLGLNCRSSAISAQFASSSLKEADRALKTF